MLGMGRVVHPDYSLKPRVLHRYFASIHSSEFLLQHPRSCGNDGKGGSKTTIMSLLSQLANNGKTAVVAGDDSDWHKYVIPNWPLTSKKYTRHNIIITGQYTL